METHVTTGKLALPLGCQHWHIVKLIERKAIPYSLAGRYRPIAVSDIDRVREALVAAGYLRKEGAPAQPPTPCSPSPRSRDPFRSASVRFSR